MIGQTFMLAGRAVFTVRNDATGTRFTYRVSKKEAEPGSRYGDAPTYFVGVLSGPDNTADYSYLGILDPQTGYVRLTRRSRFAVSAPCVRAIQWLLPKLWARVVLPPSLSLHHEGRCGRCGRALTVPESIASGFGPECSETLGIAVARTPKPAMLGPVRNTALDGEFDGTLDMNEARASRPHLFEGDLFNPADGPLFEEA